MLYCPAMNSQTILTKERGSWEKLFAAFFLWMVPSSFLTVASLGLAGVPTAHVPQPVPSSRTKTKQNKTQAISGRGRPGIQP